MKKGLFVIALAASTALAGGAFAGVSSLTPEEKAASIAEEIVTMRSALAGEFIAPGAEITEDTFKKVCGAVGKRAMEISEKEGVKIRHAATRYRNPNNAADEREAGLIKRFEEEAGLAEVTERLEADGVELIRYTRPVIVEQACLACHGGKDARPGFIKAKYPDDRAFGFREGDLRGIITVTVPAR